MILYFDYLDKVRHNGIDKFIDQPSEPESARFKVIDIGILTSFVDEFQLEPLLLETSLLDTLLWESFRLASRRAAATSMIRLLEKLCVTGCFKSHSSRSVLLLVLWTLVHCVYFFIFGCQCLSWAGIKLLLNIAGWT